MESHASPDINSVLSGVDPHTAPPGYQLVCLKPVGEYVKYWIPAPVGVPYIYYIQYVIPNVHPLVCLYL